jgi:hypothetical protein
MPPFVRQWPRLQTQLAEQMGRSLLFWYRQQYHLPRHDPRLADLTLEELALEYAAWQVFQTPPPAEPNEDAALATAWHAWCEAGHAQPGDREALQAFVTQWREQHAPAEADDSTLEWEPLSRADWEREGSHGGS